MRTDHLKLRYVALKHWILWNILSKKLECILVSEYPKSGGTWFCKMLSEAAGIPFPQNFQIPKFEKSLLHGVFRYSRRNGKIICLVRDGRDVMVSAYYFFLFRNDRNYDHSVERYRQAMPFSDYENIEKNLPRFIEYMFTKYTVRSKVTSWAEFNSTFLDQKDVLFVRYENLLFDAVSELRNVLEFLNYPPIDSDTLSDIVDKYSFSNLSQRKPGEENKSSFMRKGIAGDWGNKFSAEACKTFNKFGGEMLISLGYETNDSWKESISAP